MTKCTMKIGIHEVDGKKCDEFTNILTVKSYKGYKIIIEIENKEYLLNADELRRAITNCIEF